MSEFNEVHTSEAEVFIVRGHHAARLYNLLGMGMSVNEVLDNAEDFTPEPYAGYREDVFGTTPEEASVARDTQRNFFTDFLNLPDDAQVRFVAGQKDAICDSCTIGKHCETLPQRSDSRFLNTLGRIARERGMEDFIINSEVSLEGLNRPSPVLQMPAWLAKEILGDVDFHAQTFPRLFRPLARKIVRYSVTHPK